MTTGKQTVTEETADSFKTRAFEYGEEATQFPFYVRVATLDAWQDADDVEVTPSLVQDDVKDDSTSEKHDAMVQLALDHPDLLVEYIKEARGIPDADTDAFSDELRFRSLFFGVPSASCRIVFTPPSASRCCEGACEASRRTINGMPARALAPRHAPAVSSCP